ncbi:acetyl-CoA carboxylase biotin carboxyl carrier protein [Oceanobacillus sp. CAU 1775]
MLKVQEIREIIKLIDDSSITEFNYETDGTTISLKKGSNEVVSGQNINPVQAEVPKPAPQQVQATSEKSQEETNENDTKSNETVEEQGTVDFDYEITSPMVGTFYAAPSPEDEDYVAVGSKVESDTVVCIVEAMKLFNEIEAEASGEIVEVVASNGELVEYGQVLFRVKKK